MTEQERPRTREVLDYVEAVVRTRPEWTAERVALATARVFTAGLPWWQRIRFAWRVIR